LNNEIKDILLMKNNQKKDDSSKVTKENTLNPQSKTLNFSKTITKWIELQETVNSFFDSTKSA